MQKLGVIVGGNVRAIRKAAGKTLDDVVHAASKYGGRYSTGHIGEFESGVAGPTLRNLLVMASALSEVSGRTVTMADLCEGDGDVQVSAATINLADLRDALNGKPVQLKACQPSIREAERRILRELDMSFDELNSLAQQLWGHSFVDERNRRAGLDGNAQRRGQIARDLKAELRIAHRMRNP